MGKLKIDIKDKKVKLKGKFAKSIYKILQQIENIKVELVFVTKDAIQSLNKQHRQKDEVTDVLSFPNLADIRGRILKKEDFPNDSDKKYIILGSIAICTDRAKEQAEEIGHSFDRELVYLTIHGILHLFGYDHETEEDKKQMRDIEKTIVTDLGFLDA